MKGVNSPVNSSFGMTDVGEGVIVPVIPALGWPMQGKGQLY